MRPVNLIPSEDRPGGRRPARSGPVAYVVVGALALALIGVSVLVVSGNQISDRKAEITRIEGKVASTQARAGALSAYTQFHSVREQRVATVTSLADSRFDWERVMRELALILPGDVWLTNLTGTASPGVSVEGSSTIDLRSTVPGPALEVVGCARSQDAVAGFVQALKEIDGVTRVGVQSSELGTGAESASSTSTASTCQTRSFIAQFQMVVAFDAAPVPLESGVTGETAAAPVPTEAAPEGEG
jgi:Tfp pilus assembly protein PilN